MKRTIFKIFINYKFIKLHNSHLWISFTLSDALINNNLCKNIAQTSEQHPCSYDFPVLHGFTLQFVERETCNKEDDTKSLLEITIICSSCYQQFFNHEMHSIPSDQIFRFFECNLLSKPAVISQMVECIVLLHTNLCSQ